jgi:predicted lipoprotein with Yx(FWY)xxD motif
MKTKILYSTLLVFGLVLSACGTAAPSPTTAPVATVMPATAMPVATAVPVIPVTGATATPVGTLAPVALPAQPAFINVSQNSTLGSILVDLNGMTLYVFTKDTPATGSSAAVTACVGACATTWPPLLTNGAPVGGDGVTASLLGSLTRPDGSSQVTYNGWPLYRYSMDNAAGDATGQGYKGLWYAVTPEGMQASSAMPASSATNAPAATMPPESPTPY